MDITNGTARWVRTDKETGETVGLSERMVEAALNGYYRDVRMAMATGVAQTPFGIYEKSPSPIKGDDRE